MENLNSLDNYSQVQPGLREKTKITAIRKAKAREIFGEQYWNAFRNKPNESPEDFGNRMNHAKEQDVIELTTENGATLVISLPHGTQYHPKSKLAGFVKLYRSLPKIGIEVETENDQNGYRKVVI